MSDTSFIVVGEFETNNPHGIRIYNTNFEKIGEYAAGYSIDKIRTTANGDFIIVDREKLYFSDSNFQFIDSILFSDYGHVVDIEADSGGIYVLTQNEFSPPTILEFNNDFELINSWSYGNSLLRISDLALSPEEVAISGYVISRVPLEGEELFYASSSGFFKSFSRTSFFEPENNDIEVANLRIPFFQKTNQCNNEYEPGFVAMELPAVLVDVVNHGDDIINEGFIFFQVEGIQICRNGINNNATTYLEKQKFFGLNLLSGDTATISISNFEFRQDLDSSYHIDACTWITAADRKLDVNNENDFFCGKIKLDGIDYGTTNKLIGIYPNPTSEILNVSLKYDYFKEIEFEIYNNIGVVVYEGIIPALSNKKIISIFDFPQGMYFFRVKNNDRLEETIPFIKINIE